MSPPLPPTPASPSVTPVVRLPIGEGRTVVFSLATFERIETATGITAGELMQKLSGMTSIKTPDGKPDGAAIVKAFSVTTVAKFIAACLAVPLEQLEPLVPPAAVLGIFGPLAEGFSEAARQLYSAGAEAESESSAAPNPPEQDGGGS